MSKGGKRRSTPRSSARRARAEDRRDDGGEPPRHWRVLYFVAIAAIWCGVAVASVLAYFAADLPSTEGLWRQERAHAVTLLDVNGRQNI